MELTDRINHIFEDTITLENLLAVDNVEAVTPDDNDIISVGEESMIEECLNDTDGSLSSVNLDFFNIDPSKPAKGRRKKTMGKRKEERMSFRYLVDDATVSDNEDEEDFSSISSVYSDSPPVVLERKKLNRKPSRDFYMASTSKETEGTVNNKKIGAHNIYPKMKTIYLNRRRDNSSNLKKAVRTPKSDREGKSKSDDERNLDRLLNVYRFEQKRYHTKIDHIKSNMRIGKRLLSSKSVEELRRNYEEDQSESEEETTEALKRVVSNIDFKIPSTGKHRHVSEVDKIILLSPKSGKKKKSESSKEFQNIEIANEAIDDVETPSTSKNANVPKKGVSWLQRRLLSESDEEEKSESREEWNKNLNGAKKKVVRRKRRVSAKCQEVANNAHIYSFFSSMADLVSTLPYSTTLTAKARMTKMLVEMVQRVEKWNSDRSPLKPMEGHEISELDLKLIKLRLSVHLLKQTFSSNKEELHLF